MQRTADCPGCLSFRLRRHIHQLVPLKHRAVEVTAAVVVRLSADRCGDATWGRGGNHGAQRQRCPGGCRRQGRRCSSLLLSSGSLLLGGGSFLSAAAACAEPRPSAVGPGPSGPNPPRGLWPLPRSAVRRRVPRIACASGTSCTGRSGTSAMSIKTRARLLLQS